MNEDPLSEIIDFARQEIAKAARLDPEKKRKQRRNATLRTLVDLWLGIYESPPRDEKNSLDRAKLDDWLIRFNERIGRFVTKVKKTEFGEFLRYLPSTNKNQAICVALLNQPSRKRLATMRKLTPKTSENAFWHQSFEGRYILDRLLEWKDVVNRDNMEGAPRSLQSSLL